MSCIHFAPKRCRLKLVLILPTLLTNNTKQKKTRQNKTKQNKTKYAKIFAAAAGAMGVEPTGDVPGQLGKNNRRQRGISNKNPGSLKGKDKKYLFFFLQELFCF